MMDDWTLRAVVSSQLNEAKKKSASKPVSRILFPGLAGVAIIPLAPALLPGSSDLPESCPSDGVGGAGTPPLLFGLAPCGVYLAPDITIGAVRSYPAERGRRSGRTFSPLPVSPSPRQPRAGGMFSVALSVSQAYGPRGHPPATLAVSEHTTLRSSDFPLPRHCHR